MRYEMSNTIYNFRLVCNKNAEPLMILRHINLDEIATYNKKPVNNKVNVQMRRSLSGRLLFYIVFYKRE